MSRAALGILRQATAPMTLRDFTYVVMTRLGKDQTDAQQVRSMMERIRATLSRQRKVGALRSAEGSG